MRCWTITGVATTNAALRQAKIQRRRMLAMTAARATTTTASRKTSASMEATRTHRPAAATQASPATTPAAAMTLVAISISVGPILAGVGSTRAAAATPGSNVVASCEALVRSDASNRLEGNESARCQYGLGTAS